MNIFVIGAGNVGGGQVRSAVKAGHKVTVFAETSEKLTALTSET